MLNKVTTDSLVKGTRIISFEEADVRRMIIHAFFIFFAERGYREVVLPSIERSSIYVDKAGQEILGQMYSVESDLCLRPEGTATCQFIAQKSKFDKDIKLMYECRCWRKEDTRKGRYNEFTQLGIEVLNPSKDYLVDMMHDAIEFLKTFLPAKDIELNVNAKRGLAYYTGDGFEIKYAPLGKESQILGGGRYNEGVGFAIGLDRLVIAIMELRK